MDQTSESDNSETSFAYDRVAYPGAADESINPRNLEVVGAMVGLQPADLSACRVLELGCADGTNLLPFALEFPDSQFVGVDLAGERIQQARAVADEIGLQNVTFHHANVSDVDSSFGTFDYILCPGVFSWVTDDERHAMLRACRELLTPNGIAVISYNTLPGWNWSGSLRDFIRHHVRFVEDPEQQIAEAKNAIEFIAANTSTKTAHGAYYARIRDQLRGLHDPYLYHDYISDRNRPFYFHQFTSLAAEHELMFVAEADFKHSSGFGLDPTARAAIMQAPPQEREQLLDFLLNTNHRRSILCHRDREFDPVEQHERICQFDLVLTTPLREFDPSHADPIELPFESGAVTISDPLVKAAIRHLSDVWPSPVKLDPLFEASQTLCAKFATNPLTEQEIDREGLARTMLAFYGAGLIQVFKTRPVLNDHVSEYPQVSPLVRATATHGLAIVDQWHQNVNDLGTDERYLLSLLDGSRDVVALTSALEEFRANSATNAPQEPNSPRPVAELLDRFLKQRLLTEAST